MIRAAMCCLTSVAETYGYDANSNRISHADFNGQTHTMAHDNLDRMVSASYADGSVHSYVYDAEGNRTQSQIVDADGTRTWSYAYDNRNRLTQETKPKRAASLCCLKLSFC